MQWPEDDEFFICIFEPSERNGNDPVWNESLDRGGFAVLSDIHFGFNSIRTFHYFPPRQLQLRPDGTWDLVSFLGDCADGPMDNFFIF